MVPQFEIVIRVLGNTADIIRRNQEQTRRVPRNYRNFKVVFLPIFVDAYNAFSTYLLNFISEKIYSNTKEYLEH